jgi:acetyl-CoA carboxylase biotin carboxyl carrier protein
VDLTELRKIIVLVEKSDIHELEIEEEGRRIRVCKLPPAVPPANPAPAVLPLPAAAAPTPEIARLAPQAAEKEPAAEAEQPRTEGVDIVAPMIGTFYRAPAPEAPPYVQVGDTVTPDTVVCIVEAMKVMNEIKAGVSGRVVDVLVENAQPVEFGQPLFRVKPE